MVQQVEKEELEVHLMNIITIFEMIIRGRHWLYILYYIIPKQQIIVSESIIFKTIQHAFFSPIVASRVKICETSLTKWVFVQTE